MLLLNENGTGFINNDIASLISRRGHEIDKQIDMERDYDITYFGYKTLERSYLLKKDEKTVV